MTDKQFHLRPEQIDRLIEDPRGCLATDRIVVDGEPVGYMYREESTVDEDSGWRFMAGDESDEYMADANNIGVYALNSIANYDRDIIPLLVAPVGAYFARDETGGDFVRLLDPDDDTIELGLHPDFPVVEGEYRLTNDWKITLDEPCNRRVEDGSMVIWRPGLTAHIVAWDNTPEDSVADRVNQLMDSVSPSATDLVRTDGDEFTRVKYRVSQDGTDTIATFVVGERSQLLAQLQFDDEASGSLANQIADSIQQIGDDDLTPGLG